MPHLFCGQTKHSDGRVTGEDCHYLAGFAFSSHASRFSFSSLASLFSLSSRSSSPSLSLLPSISLSLLSLLSLLMGFAAPVMAKAPCASSLQAAVLGRTTEEGQTTFKTVSYKESVINEKLALILVNSTLAGLEDEFNRLARLVNTPADLVYIMQADGNAKFKVEFPQGQAIVWKIQEIIDGDGRIKVYIVEKEGLTQEGEDQQVVLGQWKFYRIEDLAAWTGNELATVLTQASGKHHLTKTALKKIFAQYRQEQRLDAVPLLRPKKYFETAFGWSGEQPSLQRYILAAEAAMNHAELFEPQHQVANVLAAAAKKFFADTPWAKAVRSFKKGDDFPQNFYALELQRADGNARYYFLKDYASNRPTEVAIVSSILGAPYSFRLRHLPRAYIHTSADQSGPVLIDNAFLEIVKDIYEEGNRSYYDGQRFAANLAYAQKGSYKEQTENLGQAIEQYARKADLQLHNLKVSPHERGNNVISFNITLNRPHTDYKLVENVTIRLGPKFILDARSRYFIEKENRMLYGERGDEDDDYLEGKSPYIMERSLQVEGVDVPAAWANKHLMLPPQEFRHLSQLVGGVEGLLGNYVLANRYLAGDEI